MSTASASLLAKTAELAALGLTIVGLEEAAKGKEKQTLELQRVQEQSLKETKLNSEKL